MVFSSLRIYSTYSQYNLIYIFSFTVQCATFPLHLTIMVFHIQHVLPLVLFYIYLLYSLRTFVNWRAVIG